jgi:hypothetical protein
MGAEPFLTPIISGIAGKLGLPPQIAQMVVTFVLGKLLAGHLGGAAAPAPDAQTSGATEQQGVDLAHLVEQMNSGQGVGVDFLRSSGMAEELSQQSGLDLDTAEASLQEAFTLLGDRLGSVSQ